MRRPASRGPLSAWVDHALAAGSPDVGPAPVVPDEHAGEGGGDEQLALWMLYELHYRGFDDTDPDADGWPGLLAARRDLEDRLERRWRDHVDAAAAHDPDPEGDLAGAFFDLCELDVPSVARFVQREATRPQVDAVLRQRSIYHVKEQDAAMWALPRVDDDTKAHLMAIAFDEYGNGDPRALHARLWEHGMRACGLDPAYGAYVDQALPEILEQSNLASLLGMNRRLVPAALGHLAAFEVTSAVPCRRIVRGLERLAVPEPMVGYFREHMLADAVHEQVAVRRMLGSYVAAHPGSRPDVFWGAAACLLAEGEAGRAILDAVREPDSRDARHSRGDRADQADRDVA